ncbi:hypothetical protein ACL02T_34645 [Pseudonocardia sp. RS010]
MSSPATYCPIRLLGEQSNIAHVLTAGVNRSGYLAAAASVLG